MNELVSKLAGLLPELEAHGPVYLYALAEREDVNRWDVIFSAAWSDDDHAAAVRVVADVVRAHIDASEITQLSRVVILPSSNSEITKMPRSLEAVASGDVHLINVSLADSETRRTYVFKARRPSSHNQSEEVATATASHL